MKEDKSVIIDFPPQLLKNSLQKKVKKLNSGILGYKYSMDVDDYEFSGMMEINYRVHEFRFVEKKSNKTITIEIKSFG